MPRSHSLLRSFLLLVALASCNETTTEPGTSPVAAPSFSTTATTALAFYQVSGGQGHTCAITTDNRAYCWGENMTGQLGDGTTTSHLKPVAVLGGLRFQQISAGVLGTCGITLDYRAYCWGFNNSGQIGDGSLTQRLAPVPVASGRRFRQVDLNGYHTCAVSYPDPGQALCWGANYAGQLGDGTKTNRTRPTVVVGALVMRQVTAGAHSSCGVTTSNLAYCWGSNTEGELGDSSNTRQRSVPSRVAGGHQFLRLDAGDVHVCAVAIGDRAFCWGNGRSGQIGNGRAYLSFWPRAVAGGLYFTRVTGGGSHTCGETRGNQAYCWGHNSDGDLGDGTTTQRLTPVLVAGGHTFKQVSAGGFHSCGKTDTSALYCWGWNALGQIGDGTKINRLKPVRIAGP
jgi:alpha-tubulin suppressor-like RCC1 family protein